MSIILGAEIIGGKGMDVLMQAWNFFNDNIFGKPAFFVGILVFIGYVLLKKPVYEAFAGFIKATVGYMILNVGSNGLTNNFRPILAGLNERFQLSAAVIDPYYGQVADKALTEAAGRSLSLAMSILILGFFINILLVALKKVTKIRSLMITGHTMVGQCYAALWIVLLTMPFLSDFEVIIFGGILMGVFWGVATNLTVEPTQDLTDGAGFCIGHNQCFGIWTAYKFGKLVKSNAQKDGKEVHQIDKIKFPGFLKIFDDNVVATGVIMMLFFGVIIAILGKDMMQELDSSFSASQNFVFYIIEKSLNFSVYMSVLLLGVRMFVAELAESFHGISEKLLPGVVPGIDCAGVFGFAPPSAMTFGFLCGVAGQFLAILGLLVFKSPVLIITGFVPVFFDNAAMACYANKRGGVKAAAILTFCTGIIQVLGGAFCAWFYGQYQFGGARGNFDWVTVWPAFTVIMEYGKYIGLAAVILILLAIPQLQYRKNKETYFKVTTHWEEVRKTYDK